MSDKSLTGNRQEVSELVEFGEMMSLSDIEYEQECKERGARQEPARGVRLHDRGFLSNYGTLAENDCRH